jgi:hypothetical protein
VKGSVMRLFAVSAVVAMGLATLAIASGMPPADAASGGAPVAALARVAVPDAAHRPATAGAGEPSGDLLDVSCASAASCVGVGQTVPARLPLVESWNGHHWTATDLAMPAGQNGATLNGVSCPARGSCIAAGESGLDNVLTSFKPLVESWNGQSWSAVPVPVPGGYGYELGNVACTSAASCVLTGIYSLRSGRTAGFADVLRAGRWTDYKLPGLVSNRDNSIVLTVTCRAAAWCAAVGGYGNATAPSGVPANHAVAEFWNGKKWSLNRVPAPAGTKGAWLYGLACPSSSTCIATGGERRSNGTVRPLIETWNRASRKWRAASPAAAGKQPSVGAVSCLSARHCLAVGSGDQTSAQTSPFSLSWNGRSWKYTRMPYPLGGSKEANEMSSIQCLSPTLCIAAADEGNIPYHTGNYLAYGVSAFWNGKSWRLTPIS